MKMTVFIYPLVLLFLFSACSKKEASGTDYVQAEKEQPKNLYTIVANGYGESKEKAIEDARNDALRQFGYNIVNIGGKPELTYAGKIHEVTVIKEFTEELKNGMWWEVKVEARIEKL
jgi:hypothetical protein